MKNRKTKSENNLQPHDALVGAIYGRASTEALVEAESLKKQEYYGLKYAEQLSSQLGIKHTVKYVLIEEYAASGADRDRKKLKVLMSLIRAKKIKFLIIEEISRLSRILAHLLETLQTCKEFGVAVYIRSLPGVNLHSAAGEMLIGMLGSAAQFERSLTIERVRNTLRAAALREGKINGGSIIYGFERDPLKKGSWIPVPEELKNIELLMEKFIACGSVAETLELAKTLGIKNKSGNYFTFSSLKKLFECRKLVGELLVRHGIQDEQQTVVKLPFGEVINRHLFEKVQAALAQHESLRTNMNRRGDKIYLLTGLLFHKNGSSFSGHSGTSRSGKKVCYYFDSKTKMRIDADKIEQKILKSLSNTFEDEIEIETKSKALSDSKEHQVRLIDTRIEEFHKELSEIKNKETLILTNLTTIAAPSDTVTQWLEDQINEVRKSRKHIGEQIQELEDKKDFLKSSVSDLRSIKSNALKIFLKMKKADPINQRHFLRQIIEKIEMSPSGEVLIIWRVSDLFTAPEETVASDKKWLRRRDSNPRPSG